MTSEFPDSWRRVLDQKTQGALQDIECSLELEEAEHTIWPLPEDRYRALKLVPPDKVRVVILGQDPYYQEGLANGLAFSVNAIHKKIPPSLNNIFKEVNNNKVGATFGGHGNLECWAEQGVLLLNSILTVEEGKPKSHRRLHWGKVTPQLLRYIWENKQPTVFMLWGREAQRSAGMDKGNDDNKVLKAAHPSPRSCIGFFGKNHFSCANRWLSGKGVAEIDWSVP